MSKPMPWMKLHLFITFHHNFQIPATSRVVSFTRQRVKKNLHPTENSMLVNKVSELRGRQGAIRSTERQCLKNSVWERMALSVLSCLYGPPHCLYGQTQTLKQADVETSLQSNSIHSFKHVNIASKQTLYIVPELVTGFPTARKTHTFLALGRNPMDVRPLATLAVAG